MLCGSDDVLTELVADSITIPIPQLMQFPARVVDGQMLCKVFCYCGCMLELAGQILIVLLFYNLMETLLHLVKLAPGATAVGWVVSAFVSILLSACLSIERQSSDQGTNISMFLRSASSLLLLGSVQAFWSC